MTKGLSNPKVRSLRPGEKKIDFNRDFNKRIEILIENREFNREIHRKTTFADFSLLFEQTSLQQSFL